MSDVNLALASNFLFTLSRPELAPLELFVTEFTGLGVSFTDVTPTTYANQTFKRPGGNLTFNDLNLQISMDENFDVLYNIYEIMLIEQRNLANNTENENANFEGILYLNSNRNNLKKKIRFSNCWIRDMSDVVFTTTQMTADPLSVPLTIAFDKYEIENIA